MKIRHITSVLALLVLVGGLLLFASEQAVGLRQAKNEFSEDPATFVQELSDMFDLAADAERNVTVKESLNSFMNTGSADMRSLFMQTCNRLRRLRARPYPDYVTCINSFILIDQSDRIKGSDLAAWRGAFEKRLSGRGSTLVTIRNFLEFTDAYISQGALCLTKSHVWKTDSRCSLVDRNGELFIEVPEGTLRCVSQGDSIEILKTSGTFSFSDQKFVGNKGLITWERAGLDPASVFATFGHYEFSLKSTTL